MFLLFWFFFCVTAVTQILTFCAMTLDEDFNTGKAQALRSMRVITVVLAAFTPFFSWIEVGQAFPGPYAVFPVVLLFFYNGIMLIVDRDKDQ
jgi:hypothetical protein